VERDELFEAHYPLAVSLARRFARRTRSSEPVEDLVQVALLALVGAVDRYDPSVGVPLGGFAAATVVGALKRYVRDRSWSVRPPRRLQELYLMANEASADLSQQLGRAPSPGEIAEQVGCPQEAIVEALQAGRLRTADSFDDPGWQHGVGGAEDRAMARVDEQLSVDWLLTRLPERQRRLLQLHYLEGLSQHQIADELRISQAHVQRLLTRSLTRLRVLAAAC
jgi:RNA polymerase sigma-B factor